MYFDDRCVVDLHRLWIDLRLGLRFRQVGGDLIVDQILEVHAGGGQKLADQISELVILHDHRLHV